MKYRSFLFSFLFVFLCSCAGAGKVSPIFKGIAFTANISYENETYTCDITIKKDGSSKVIFHPTDDLTEQTVSITGDSVTAEFCGLSHAYTWQGAQSRSPAELLIFVVKDAQKEPRKLIAKNGSFLIRKRNGGLTYTLYFASTGLPLSVESKEMGFFAEFQNIRIL